VEVKNVGKDVHTISAAMEEQNAVMVALQPHAQEICSL
jgi:hypothetical protein